MLEEERQASALKIQRNVRMFFAKKELKRLKEEKRKKEEENRKNIQARGIQRQKA